jgi:hypothetical protein
MSNTRAALPTNPQPDDAVTDRLALEWRRLTVTRAELMKVRAWQLPGGDVRTLDDVLERSGYRPAPGALGGTTGQGGRAPRRGAPAIADEAVDAYLLRLLQLAKTEPLAARIVLQRILPALSGIARRHSAGRDQQLALLDDLVANAWSIIRAFPVERRTRRIAANLVRDIGFETLVRPRRRRQADEMPTATDQLDRADVRTVDPLIELSEVLWAARHRGVVSDEDVQLLGELIRLGRADLVAAGRGVTSRTVRNHRDAAVHRLRSFVADAA